MTTATPVLDQTLVRDILRVLCRVPIGKRQLVLYRFAVGALGKGFTSDDVKKFLQLDQAQHRGLMSALANRINNTPIEADNPWPGLGLLFRQQWDGQQNTYWPHPELLEAIRRLPTLDALMQRPLADVAKSNPFRLQLPPGVPQNPPRKQKEPDPKDCAFYKLTGALNKAGLVFPAELISNLLLALQVKRFVILTGISGTGKTRIGQTIARWFGKDATSPNNTVENLEVIAVRPDWTDHRGLLGHYNPLTRTYVSTPFLRLLLRAWDHYKQPPSLFRKDPLPFFVILDEMNLARVEHYFADFLSALESGESVHLHDIPELEQAPDDKAIPRRLAVPPNLFFIGTVNVDETTHFFSPKVLDRAFTLEFDRVILDEFEQRDDASWEPHLWKWNGRLDPPNPVDQQDWQWLAKHRGGELTVCIKDIHQRLARHHRHFGYRVAQEMARFIRLAVDQADEPEQAAWIALDLAILQKVLVKLHGTQTELEELLRELLDYALTGGSADAAFKDINSWKLDPAQGKVVPRDEASEEAPLLPRSAAKLWRMRERLQRQGFTGWIE